MQHDFVKRQRISWCHLRCSYKSFRCCQCRHESHMVWGWRYCHPRRFARDAIAQHLLNDHTNPTHFLHTKERFFCVYNYPPVEKVGCFHSPNFTVDRVAVRNRTKQITHKNRPCVSHRRFTQNLGLSPGRANSTPYYADISQHRYSEYFHLWFCKIDHENG